MPLPSFPRLAFVFREAKTPFFRQGGFYSVNPPPYETP